MRTRNSEIRAYANIISEIVKLWVPIAHEAFADYRQNSIQLSGKAAAAIRKMFGREDVSLESSGLSAMEWAEAFIELWIVRAPEEVLSYYAEGRCYAKKDIEFTPECARPSRGAT